MPLPTFASPDEIPESFRSAYVERDGKWVADVEDASGLKAAQRRALDEKKKLEDAMRSALGGKSLDDAAAALAKLDEIEQERQKKAGEFDKLLEKRLGETRAEYEKRIAELAPYKAKYEDKTLSDAIRSAAIKAGVIPEDIDEYVIPVVKGRRVMLDASGAAVVVDKDGDVTGQSLDKFFGETFRAEAPKFYRASGASGGGASAGGSRHGQSAGGSSGTIDLSDTSAIAANVDMIAAGKVRVA